MFQVTLFNCLVFIFLSFEEIIKGLQSTFVDNIIIDISYQY